MLSIFDPKQFLLLQGKKQVVFKKQIVTRHLLPGIGLAPSLEVRENQ